MPKELNEDTGFQVSIKIAAKEEEIQEVINEIIMSDF